MTQENPQPPPANSSTPAGLPEGVQNGRGVDPAGQPAAKTGKMKPSERKDSLLVKISAAYLLLTMLNLLLFWAAIGANQMRLVRDKAVLEAKVAAAGAADEWGSVLGSVQGNLSKMSRKKRETRIQRQLTESRLLRGRKDWTVVDQFGKIIAGQDLDLTAARRKGILKALQMNEMGARFYVGTVELDTQSYDMYIPYIFGKNEWVVLSSSRLPVIGDELAALFWLGGIVVVLLLAGQTLLGWILFRLIIRPVRILDQTAQQITAGDLKARLSENGRADDIGRLMHNFNEMVSALDRQTEEITLANGILERFKHEISEELELGSKIQVGLMPQTSPDSRYPFYIHYAPLQKVSGDYYDLVSFPDGSLIGLVADVSGHGIPAALIMTLTKALITKLGAETDNLDQLATELNTLLVRYIVTRDFLTAFLFRITPESKLQFVSAGHPPVYIVGAQDGALYPLKTPGFLLGMRDPLPIAPKAQEISWEPGDRLFLFSDGIYEAADSSGENYGQERLQECIRRHAGKDLAGFVNGVAAEVAEFQGNEDPEDDVTIFVLENAAANANSSEIR